MAIALEDRLLPLAHPVGHLRLWALRLDPRAGDADAGPLSARDQDRLSGLPAAEVGRFLARRALLRAAVAGLAGCSPSGVHLVGAEGPRIAEFPGGSWHVSLSSCGPWGLLALSGVAVGVDVERLPGPPDAAEVGDQLLPAPEAAWIRRGPDLPRRFLEVWVRKEAVVKCTGEGLRRDLRSFVVDAAAPSAAVTGPDGRPFGIRTRAVGFPGHVAAVALVEPAAALPEAD